MREIKFRGKSIADSISHRCKKDEWVYGSALHSSFSKTHSYIVQLVPEMFDKLQLRFQSIDVIRETVGQFTGLLDKSGKEVYEGDILQCDDPEDKSTCVIEWEYGAYWKNWCDYETKRIIYGSILSPDDLKKYSLVVIGNIYQNPEIMGDCKKDAPRRGQ